MAVQARDGTAAAVRRTIHRKENAVTTYVRRLLWIPLLLLLTAPAFGAAPPDVGPLVGANCTDITNPVANQTWCFQQSDGTLRVYDGVSWILASTFTKHVTEDGAACNITTTDTTSVQTSLDRLTPGIHLSFEGLHDRCKITSALRVGTNGWNLDFGATGFPPSTGVGPVLWWQGAADGTVFETQGSRWELINRLAIDGGGTAGIGYNLINAPGAEPRNVTSENVLDRPFITDVAGRLASDCRSEMATPRPAFAAFRSVPRN